jgi:D-glycero-beta-D-manno-heptose 1-phosphate adenylyltransferase
MIFNIFDHKIKNRMALAKILETLRNENKKIVFTNGCFDIIHAGHCIYLELARMQGDILVVAVNSDESVKLLKGKNKPVFPLSERMEILSSFQFVDFVTSFYELDPLDIIKELKPDVLVKGADWPIDKVIGREFVESNGGVVKTIPMVEGLSTSKIIEKILNTG